MKSPTELIAALRDQAKGWRDLGARPPFNTFPEFRQAAIDADQAAAVFEAIDELRGPAGHGGCVTIPNDNDDNDERAPVACVDCMGDWTGFDERRFEGPHWMQAVVMAAATKQALREEGAKK